MKRLHQSLALFLSALLVSVALSIGPAQAAGTLLAVYNNGRAQVTETRAVTLPEGAAAVVFADIPATLDPTSIRAQAPGMTVRDIQYAYHAIDTRNLLDAYVGKDLTVILPDPADANARILRQAKLLSNADRPIFSMGKEVYVGNYEALLLPELPKGFDAEPTLTLTADTTAAGKKSVSLSYLMDGLSWRADYALTVGQAGGAGALDAWATISNTSGHAFAGTDLRLIAGDVQRAPSPKLLRAQPVMMEAAMDAAPANVAEEAFSQYHVYDPGRTVSIPADGSRQISLFSAPALNVSTELTSRFMAGRGQSSGEIRQNVESALRFANTAENGLGRPMPAGLVRVFMPASDGVQLLAGEAQVGHVAEGGDVRLVLGNSFDVSVTRVQTAFTRIGKNGFEAGWRITVSNGSKVPQDLKLVESFSGQWKVLSADRDYASPDAGSIEFDLKSVPPSAGTEGTIINYAVRVEY